MATIVKLEYPITIGGKEITQLELRRPLVRDLMIANKIESPGESEVTLIANLCGLSPDEIGKLDAGDYGSLQLSLSAMQKKKAGQTVTE